MVIYTIMGNVVHDTSPVVRHRKLFKFGQNGTQSGEHSATQIVLPATDEATVSFVFNWSYFQHPHPHPDCQTSEILHTTMYTFIETMALRVRRWLCGAAGRRASKRGCVWLRSASPRPVRHSAYLPGTVRMP